MRLRFGEKREYKIYTRLMSGFFTCILFMFSIITKKNPFETVEVFIFTCLLVIFGWIGISSMELVENAEFFSQGDRRARFKESSRNQLTIFITIMIMIYIFIHIVWMR